MSKVDHSSTGDAPARHGCRATAVSAAGAVGLRRVVALVVQQDQEREPLHAATVARTASNGAWKATPMMLTRVRKSWSAYSGTDVPSAPATASTSPYRPRIVRATASVMPSRYMLKLSAYWMRPTFKSAPGGWMTGLGL